jgi:hypothetical protein
MSRARSNLISYYCDVVLRSFISAACGYLLPLFSLLITISRALIDEYFSAKTVKNEDFLAQYDYAKSPTLANFLSSPVGLFLMAGLYSAYSSFSQLRGNNLLPKGIAAITSVLSMMWGMACIQNLTPNTYDLAQHPSAQKEIPRDLSNSANLAAMALCLIPPMVSTGIALWANRSRIRQEPSFTQQTENEARGHIELA